MALPTMSGAGNLLTTPELRFLPSGVGVCEVRIAFNSRRFDKQAQDWVDGPSFYVKAKAWRQLAENLVESFSTGDPVVVTGRLSTEEWQDRQSGEKRSAPVLDLDSIGPDLNRATATVNRVRRSDGGGGFGSGQQPSSGGGDSGGYADPWGAAPSSAPAADEEAPF